MNELALSAGAGGGILGGKLLGWRTICAVEIDAYCAAVLAKRQADKLLDVFPIWSDLRTFDGRRFRGAVDAVSFGFPCQNISAAGDGKGIDGDKSSLWNEGARIIREVEPDGVVLENSPLLTARGLDKVLGDLAEMGFDAEWGCISAEDSIWLDGIPAVDHLRERIWIVGYRSKVSSESPGVGAMQLLRRALVQPSRDARLGMRVSGNRRVGSRSILDGREADWPLDCPDNDLQRCKEQQSAFTEEAEYTTAKRCGWWQVEPGVDRVADGVAYRLDRLKALGNGQVPAVVPLALRLLNAIRRD